MQAMAKSSLAAKGPGLENASTYEAPSGGLDAVVSKWMDLKVDGFPSVSV